MRVTISKIESFIVGSSPLEREIAAEQVKNWLFRRALYVPLVDQGKR